MRLGIFGGTFDPPHLGHMILAEEARWQLNLDRVLWLLTPLSPLKSESVVTPWQERLRLLEAALLDNPAFEITRVDIDRSPPYYAYESVKTLRAIFPSSELIYIMGGDSLNDLPKWEKAEILIQQSSKIGIMRRPGDAIDLGQLARQFPGLAPKLVWIEAPLIDISGKLIRERIKTGAPVKYYLPGRVYRIIQEENLYV